MCCADHLVYRKLLLYSRSSETGISIPYPTIALHAIQSFPDPAAGEQQGLYMQLLAQTTDEEAGEDDEEDSISMTIIPQNDAPPPPTTSDPESHTDDHSPQPPTVAMFTALSNCSNLHPDPANDEDGAAALEGSALFQAGMIAPGDGSGGLPPPMPGSDGWITAENMGEYLDEEGNWIGGEEAGQEEALGVGAGSVRQREDDRDQQIPENGSSADTKWRTG
jgi:chloride channel, nucleotide-sensitive, 1A